MSITGFWASDALIIIVVTCVVTFVAYLNKGYQRPAPSGEEDADIQTW